MTELLDSRLVDVKCHFMLRRQYRGAGSWMWQLQREGRQVTGKGDYILSSDRDNFVNAGVREARLFTGDWMVLAVLQGEGALRNSRYVVRRMRWTLETFTVRT